jgi:hypothetical protein
MPSANIRVFFVAAAAVLLTVVPSFAQQPAPPRRSGGLLEATRPDVPDRDRLNVTASVNGALDSQLPPALGANLPSDAPVAGGFSSMMLGSADYAYEFKHAQIAATGLSAFRYYERLGRFDAVSDSAGFGASIELPRTARVRLDQSFAYSPSYLYELFPSSALPPLGAAIPAAPDYRVVQSDSYSFRSNATIEGGSARGVLVSGSVEYTRTDFDDLVAGSLRFRGKTFGGKVSHAVRRHVDLSAGYEYRTGDFQFGTSREHRVPFSAQYSRPLSLTRRANFRVSVTPSTVELIGPAFGQGGPGRLNRLQWGGAVEYQFLRTWKASGSLQREIEYLPVLTQPTLAHAGRASLEGLLTRRIDLSATTGYARGASLFDGFNSIDSNTTDVRVRFAVTRTAALYSEYVHFTYELRPEQTLPDLPRVLNLDGFRAGVVLWFSVF